MELSAFSPAMVTYGMQADYARLVQGAAAFVLAAVCFLRVSSPDGKKFWRRLALFAFLQGIAAFLGIFVWSLSKDYSLAPWIAGCELLSYGVLAILFRDSWLGGKAAELRKNLSRPAFFAVLAVLQCLLQLAVIGDFRCGEMDAAAGRCTCDLGPGGRDHFAVWHAYSMSA